MSPTTPHPAIETLQESLAWEHAAIVQMMCHAHRIHDLTSMHVLEGIARQDMRHFKWLSELVVRLGGNPTLERAPIDLAPASPTLWLGRDLAITEAAVARYALASETFADPEIRRLFTRLLADEEDHRSRLVALLDHWHAQPEPQDMPELGHMEPHGEAAQIHGFLDFAIQHEYAVILQYLHHAFLMPNQRVSRDMEEIAIEEMRHLGWLSEKLVERGGTPRWEADRLEAAEDPIEMLELDLAREIEVEADYKQVVAAMKDPEIRRLFDRIGEHETYHAGVIGEMIATLKAEKPAIHVPLDAAKCPHLAHLKTVGSLLGQAQP